METIVLLLALWLAPGDWLVAELYGYVNRAQCEREAVVYLEANVEIFQAACVVRYVHA